MAVYRRRHRQRFVLIVVTLLSVTVVTLDQRGQTRGMIDGARRQARDAFAPVQSVADDVISPVSDFFGGVAHYGELKQENTRLRQQLDEQRGIADRAAGVEREHRELLEQNDLTFVGDVQSVAARVVSSSPSNFELTFELDKGSNDGVVKDMPVVSGRGLVGRVAEAGRTRCTVVLVTDSESKVGVKFSSSGAIGVAGGRGRGAPLSVDLVDPGTRIAKREVVVTSGLQQSLYPPGLPVGRVHTARTRAGGLQETITLDPVVDLGRVTFVRILLWSPH